MEGNDTERILAIPTDESLVSFVPSRSLSLKLAWYRSYYVTMILDLAKRAMLIGGGSYRRNRSNASKGWLVSLDIVRLARYDQNLSGIVRVMLSFVFMANISFFFTSSQRNWLYWNIFHNI